MNTGKAKRTEDAGVVDVSVRQWVVRIIGGLVLIGAGAVFLRDALYPFPPPGGGWSSVEEGTAYYLSADGRAFLVLQSDPPTYPSPGVYRTGKRPELWWQLKPLNSYGTNLLAPSGEAVIQLFEALVGPLVPDATRSGGTHVTLWRRSGPDAQFRTGGYSVRSGARGAVYRWSPDRPSILEVATPSGGRYSLDTESGISTAH